MKLEKLLKSDPEAARLFDALPPEARRSIRQSGAEIGTLDALREHAVDLFHADGPFYERIPPDGTRLDPELKAQWTKEHQA